MSPTTILFEKFARQKCSRLLHNKIYKAVPELLPLLESTLGLSIRTLDEGSLLARVYFILCQA